MRKAILIGFEYNSSKKLPGITVDLYQVYQFLKRKGWKDDEIVVFTDIKKDPHTKILKNSILEKNVDSGILAFIAELKEKKQYFQYTCHNHFNNFESIFSSPVNNLFVYYTGHSKDGNIILPNQALITFTTFTKILCKYNEIFCITDCCSGGISLPFVCHEKIYRFENEVFVKPKIISIASSLETENSVTSISGSFFTKNILFILENVNLSVYQIVEKTNFTNHKNNHDNKQTVNISASYPTLCHIFPWFYSLKNISITFTPYFIEISSN